MCEPHKTKLQEILHPAGFDFSTICITAVDALGSLKPLSISCVYIAFFVRRAEPRVVSNASAVCCFAFKPLLTWPGWCTSILFIHFVAETPVVYAVVHRRQEAFFIPFVVICIVSVMLNQ